MKRFFLFTACTLFCATTRIQAQTSDKPVDSLRLVQLQQIEVVATRATAETPTPHTDLSPQQLAAQNYGPDLPFMLTLTPSLVATSETGNGIGGTSVRLRGTDGTGLNVTANGVPMNEPDSHITYFYDTPDFVSSVGTVQVQRGAGTSTNGTGAFGGAINMTTAALAPEFQGDATLSYGSYNTNKQALHVGSGLLGRHWIVDGRLSHIGSDGYIDRGATELESYMLQDGYYNGNTIVKLISFGGKAKTYLTYNGVTKEDMQLYGRRYHDSGQYTVSDSPYVLADGTHVAYYDDQTDNYLQINNQLLFNHRFNHRWQMNLTAFYTYGYGWYRQYEDDATLYEYALSADPAATADLIRDKRMRSHFGGINGSAGYTAERFSLLFGGSWSDYSSPHWGELPWVDGIAPNAATERKWYANDAHKQDDNLFVKADWEVASNLHLNADLQYRHVGYRVSGSNDNFDPDLNAMQPVAVDKQYDFFNPHVGISYTLAQKHLFYASFAIAQKEPTRTDFTDRTTQAYPSAERMYDYELGYRFAAPRLTVSANLYYMKYRNQLVHTGMVNDSSDDLNINVPDSYRRGIELSVQWIICKWLTFGANGTFSQNRIENYVDALADSPTFGQNLGTMTISYSPAVMAGGVLDFHVKGFAATLHTQYVGKQYFTNNEVDALSLPDYCTTDFNLSYTLTSKHAKSVRFGVMIYNLFDARYCGNGYGYSYMDGGKRYDDAYYFPQAPLNVLANVTITF